MSEIHRIVIITNPDKEGKQVFDAFWNTDYTPSKPYPHERGQVFKTNLEHFKKYSHLTPDCKIIESIRRDY